MDDPKKTDISRRHFIGASGAALAAAAAGPGLAATARRPNVLFILVDQMREPRFTPPGATPNLNRLSAESVRFINAFCSAVPCSPSRACLLTGTEATQNGVTQNADRGGAAAGQGPLDPRIPTLGHLFRQAGWHASYHGKWHLGRYRDRGMRLEEYGFDGWLPPDTPDGGPAYNGLVMDPVYADRAIRDLRARARESRPWFICASIINPHDICNYPAWYRGYPVPRVVAEPPPNHRDSLENKPRCQSDYRQRYNRYYQPINPDDGEAWRRYLDFYAYLCGKADEQIGRLLAALDETGQRDNTIIVFTSDHGEMGGSHGLRTKGCFVYQESVNVPLYFSWRGKIEPGIRRGPAAGTDILPTLASLAGIPVEGLPGHLAGVDLSSALFDESAVPRTHVRLHSDWTIGPTDAPHHIRAVYDGRYKFARYRGETGENQELELYDLMNDPLELENIASDRPAVVRQLTELLEFDLACDRPLELRPEEAIL